jgi:hypothetical protein
LRGNFPEQDGAMWKRTIKFNPDQTPEQRAWQEKWVRRDDARRVAMCNALQFWRACHTRECKRRHACSGDPQACFTRHWEHYPEEAKVWFRAVAKLRQDGLSTQQAMQRANDEMARVEEAEAAARRALDAALPPPQDRAASPPILPRVRTL